MTKTVAAIGLLLIALALLSAIAGFQEDGWTFEAFDTGASMYWDRCTLLCPLGIVLIVVALGATKERHER